MAGGSPAAWGAGGSLAKGGSFLRRNAEAPALTLESWLWLWAAAQALGPVQRETASALSVASPGAAPRAAGGGGLCSPKPKRARSPSCSSPNPSSASESSPNAVVAVVVVVALAASRRGPCRPRPGRPAGQWEPLGGRRALAQGHRGRTCWLIPRTPVLAPNGPGHGATGATGERALPASEAGGGLTTDCRPGGHGDTTSP